MRIRTSCKLGYLEVTKNYRLRVLETAHRPDPIYTRNHTSTLLTRRNHLRLGLLGLGLGQDIARLHTFESSSQEVSRRTQATLQRPLTTAQRSETEEVSGREIFNKIIDDLSRYFRAVEDPVNLLERLRTFHVPEGETFEVYSYKLFSLLDEIEASDSTTKKAINLSHVIDYIW